MELIVVIVILAILAAILIPGLLKWIDEAKKQKYVLEARSIAQAADAQVAKLVAKGEVVDPQAGFIIEFREGVFEDELDDISKLSGINEIILVEIEIWTLPEDGYLGVYSERDVDVIFKSNDSKIVVANFWMGKLTGIGIGDTRDEANRAYDESRN